MAFLFELYDLFGFNELLFIDINHALNIHKLQYFFKFLSLVIDPAIIPFYLLLFFAFNLYRKLAQNMQVSFGLVISAFLSYFTICSSYIFIKYFTKILRPICKLEHKLFYTVIDVNALSNISCYASFPSGHSAMSVLIAYYFIFKRKNVKVSSAFSISAINYNTSSTIFAVFLILITCLSRIGLAMHYPSDVLFSVILSYTIVILTEFMKNKFITLRAQNID